MISTLLALILIILLIAYRRSNLQKRKVEKQQQIIAQAEAMADGEERERKRLAQELHDGIASNLVAIKMQLESLVPNMGNFSDTLSLVKNTHVEVRKIAHNLMPIDFEQQNLNEVIEQFAKHMSNNQTKVQCFSKVQQFRSPIQKASILYRCIQELIQNAIKHAQATNVNVQLLQSDTKELMFIIEDNGIGVDMELWQAKRLGIYKYEERLKNIDTTFSLDSSPQSGTTIVLNTKI